MKDTIKNFLIAAVGASPLVLDADIAIKAIVGIPTGLYFSAKALVYISHNWDTIRHPILAHRKRRQFKANQGDISTPT